jgi:hypothetical protein
MPRDASLPRDFFGNPRGLYEKFYIERVDGRSAPGEKHDGCSYFVLDLTHDPHAYKAIQGYVESLREAPPYLSYPELADDLQRWLDENTLDDAPTEAP